VLDGELVFQSSNTPKNSGSGLLDILLFTGNEVSNPANMPDANGGMPGGGSTFVGDYPKPDDSNVMTVGGVLDWLHANRGDHFHRLEVELDVNEPGVAKKHPITIDQFTITIGGSTYATSPGTVLDAQDNGSGYSDYVIRGADGGIDLTEFQRTDLITFHLEASDLDAGFEEFFISATGGTPIPEPATMGLLGLGLGVMACRRWKGKPLG
jgi:hypothetical protein